MGSGPVAAGLRIINLPFFYSRKCTYVTNATIIFFAVQRKEVVLITPDNLSRMLNELDTVKSIFTFFFLSEFLDRLLHA